MSAMSVHALPSARDERDLWISAADAALALGVSERSIRRRCDGEWFAQGRARRGDRGRWIVHVSADARLAGFAASKGAQALRGRGGGEPGAAMRALARHPDAKVSAARLRARAVELLLAWRDDERVDTHRDYPVIQTRIERETGLAPARATLYEWARRCRDADDADARALALLDQRGRRAGGAVSETAWRRFESLYLSPHRLSLRHCWEIVNREAASEDWSWPSRRHVQRLAERRISPQRAVMAREGEEAWARKFGAPIEQDEAACAPGDIWEADHCQLDIAVRVVGGGKAVWRRPWLTMWMDRASRKVVGWRLSTRPNGDAIRLALLDALRDGKHGPPAIARIDNGKDFSAAAFTGGTKAWRRRMRVMQRAARTRGESLFIQPQQAVSIFGALGIEPRFANPYNHNGKARIERCFRIVHERFDREWDSWLGSRPGEVDKRRRSAITDARRIMSLPTLDQARDRFALFTEELNATTAHSIDALRDPETGATLSRADYYERALSARRVLRNPQALRLLEERLSRPLAVGKRGVGLRVAGVRVWYGSTEPALEPLKGARRRVYATYDPQDMRAVTVWTEQMAFICRVEANELYGRMTRDPVTMERLREAIAARRSQRKALKQSLTEPVIGSDLLAASDAARRDAIAEQAQGRGDADDRGAPPAPLRLVEGDLGEADFDARDAARLRKAAGAEDMDDERVDVAALLAERARREQERDEWTGASPQVMELL